MTKEARLGIAAFEAFGSTEAGAEGRTGEAYRRVRASWGVAGTSGELASAEGASTSAIAMAFINEGTDPCIVRHRALSRL